MLGALSVLCFIPSGYSTLCAGCLATYKRPIHNTVHKCHFQVYNGSTYLCPMNYGWLRERYVQEVQRSVYDEGYSERTITYYEKLETEYRWLVDTRTISCQRAENSTWGCNLVLTGHGRYSNTVENSCMPPIPINNNSWLERWAISCPHVALVVPASPDEFVALKLTSLTVVSQAFISNRKYWLQWHWWTTYYIAGVHGSLECATAGVLGNQLQLML